MSPADFTPESLAACNAAFIESVRASCLSDEDYAREYLCRPAALSELVFPEVYDRLAFESVPEILDPRPIYGPHGLFLGIDCGRAKDSTVAWVLQRGVDPTVGYWVYRTVCMMVLEKMPFPTQHAALLPILTHSQLAGGFIDQGAQGKALADSVWDETGNVIVPLGMGAKNKGEMLELMRAFAQSDRISFPANDPKTKQSVCCLRRATTLNGTLKYEGSTSFDHGDRGIACALAIYAAEGERKGRLQLPDHSQQMAVA